MTVRAISLVALFALASACNTPSTPTPAGTSLLKTTLTHAQGGPPDGAAPVSSAHKVTRIKVGGGAEVEVRVDTVDTPGGKYAQGLDLVAIDSAGGVLTAAIPAGSMPTNRGTADQVLSSISVMVNWQRVSRTKTELAQSEIEILGDGTARTQGP